jgi:hypothetical protein
MLVFVFIMLNVSLLRFVNCLRRSEAGATVETPDPESTKVDGATDAQAVPIFIKEISNLGPWSADARQPRLTPPP